MYENKHKFFLKFHFFSWKIEIKKNSTCVCVEKSRLGRFGCSFCCRGHVHIHIFIRGWKIYDSFHVISCLFHRKIFTTIHYWPAVRCVWFDSQASLKSSGSFSTGHVIHSSAKIMFTFKIWFISCDKIFNFKQVKHWTNVTPVGLHPRKKLQKTRVRHFSRQFFKTLSQSSQQ